MISGKTSPTGPLASIARPSARYISSQPRSCGESVACSRPALSNPRRKCGRNARTKNVRPKVWQKISGASGVAAREAITNNNADDNISADNHATAVLNSIRATNHTQHTVPRPHSADGRRIANSV